MSNEILDEVYAAREWLWNLGGGTMRGVCAFLMECERRAKARGVKWIQSKEELEAIGAEVRARLAREAEEGLCVGEAAGEGYVAEEAHTEAQRDGDTEGKMAHVEGRRGGEEVSGLAVDPVLGQVKEGGEWFGDGSGEWEAMS
jgi:hypothetical protein